MRRTFGEGIVMQRVVVILSIYWGLWFFTAEPAIAQGFVHVVQPGESLSVIAVRYGVSLSQLANANGIGNADRVIVGQQLTIPGAASDNADVSSGDGYVTVGRGDSLSEIAAMYGMSTSELMELNGLSDPNYVWVGQQLRVGSGGGASSSAATSAQADMGAANYHFVAPGESLSQIAQRYGISAQQLLAANGLANPDYVWAGQRLRIVGATRTGPSETYAPADGKRRIEVDLSDQTLTAWQGDVSVLYTNISSGAWGSETITGQFLIDRKYSSQRMTGPGYDIADVPWVMYFWDGYAFHGAYWHNNFGMPMSHGCVHLRPNEAQFLYNWADVGTEVIVHW